MAKRATSSGPRRHRSIAEAEAERKDRALVSSASEKKKRGEVLSREEIRAIGRQEKRARDEAIELFARAITKGEWERWSGRRRALIQEHARRFGVPVGGPTIDLIEVAVWIHAFLSEHGRKILSLEVDDNIGLLSGDSDLVRRLQQAQLEKIQTQTKLAVWELSTKEQSVMPTEDVRRYTAELENCIGGCVEILQRRFGEDAAEVVRQALERFERIVSREIEEGEKGDEATERRSDEAATENGSAKNGKRRAHKQRKNTSRDA